MEAIYVEVGQRIRRARERLGMSQAELGAQLRPKRHRASVANIENATYRVMLHTLAQVAVAVQVDMRALLPPS